MLKMGISTFKTSTEPEIQIVYSAFLTFNVNSLLSSDLLDKFIRCYGQWQWQKLK